MTCWICWADTRCWRHSLSCNAMSRRRRWTQAPPGERSQRKCSAGLRGRLTTWLEWRQARCALFMRRTRCSFWLFYRNAKRLRPVQKEGPPRAAAELEDASSVDETHTLFTVVCRKSLTADFLPQMITLDVSRTAGNEHDDLTWRTSNEHECWRVITGATAELMVMW